jgi:hypothetical protein
MLVSVADNNRCREDLTSSLKDRRIAAAVKGLDGGMPVSMLNS